MATNSSAGNTASDGGDRAPQGKRTALTKSRFDGKTITV